MTFNSYPWDGGPNMAESEWRELWRSQLDGFNSVGSLTLSNSDGTVTLSSSRGRIQGAAWIQTGSDAVTVPAVPTGQQRIDYVVLRYNPTANSVSLQTVIGTPAVTNTQEPLLEPHKSGSSLFTGPYDLPVARFTGGPGTAAQRGTGLRLRISRLHFIDNVSQSFATVNERHGDIRFLPDRIAWFDQNAGSTGQFRNIVHSPLPEPSASTSTAQTGLTTSYQPGSTPCQVTFVAGDSGKVVVEFRGYVVTTSDGARTTLSVQVRQGSTQILGPHSDYSVASGEVVTASRENVNSSSNWVEVDVEPGITYTARTMAHCTVSSGGRIEARGIRIRHVPPTS